MYRRIKKIRSFSTKLVKDLLQQGKLLDLIALRAGKHNPAGDITHKLYHLDMICDNLDTEEKVDWKDYVYLIDINLDKTKKFYMPYMAYPAFIYRASLSERIFVKNRSKISKFIVEWRKTNKNILYSRTLLVIPKKSDLGVLYKMYNCDFNTMLNSNH